MMNRVMVSYRSNVYQKDAFLHIAECNPFGRLWIHSGANRPGIALECKRFDYSDELGRVVGFCQRNAVGVQIGM